MTLRFENPTDDPLWVLVCERPPGVRHVHLLDSAEPVHGEEPHELPAQSMRLYPDELVTEVEM